MVVNSGRSLVRPALENIKVVNYEDRVIVTAVFIGIQLLLCVYSVSTLDLTFHIHLA